MEVGYLEKLKNSPELQDAEWGICQSDPYYFLTTWAKTLDVHDDINPIKTFPEKDYIERFVEVWLEEKLLLIPKSRQMMLTWLCVGLYLWDTMFHKGKLTFFQSKKEEDADDLIKRCKFIWDNLPKFLQRYQEDGIFKELTCNPQNKGQHISCKMCFPDIYSEIRGVPQGGDIVRMHTLSGLFSDEMAFQNEAKSSFTAARPTISNGGRMTCVSTAEDNTYFQELCFDLLEIV